MTANNFYNKKLKENARILRNNSTKAEIHLWFRVLKASQTGYPFRRQRPIGNYIVDFVCLPKKLIIEVDGITHSYDEVAEYDKVRQAKLEKMEFSIIPFTDQEVFHATNNVRQQIIDTLELLPLTPSKGGVNQA